MDIFKHQLLSDKHRVELIEKTVKLGSFLSPEVIKILKEIMSVSSLKDSFQVIECNCSNVDALMKEVMEKCFLTMLWAVKVVSNSKLPAAMHVEEEGAVGSESHESAMELCHSFDDLWKILVCCKENLLDVSSFHASTSQFMEQIVNIMKLLKFNEANMVPMEAISKLVSSYLGHIKFEGPNAENVAAQCEEIIQICLNHLDVCEKPQSLNMFLNNFLEPFLKHSVPAKRLYFLEILWEKCWISFHFEKGIFPRQVKPFPFMLLVFIINFVTEEDPDSFALFRNGKLLQVLEFGLVQKDPITRKQCQHIFKACLMLNKIVNHEGASYPQSELTTYNDWNEYFLCLEILEENQAHVVSPVIAKLDKFWLSAEDQPFLMPWIFVLYKRLFDHDNRTVCVWGINHLLKMQPSASGCEAWLRFLPECLLPALHDYQLFLPQCSNELPLQMRLPKFFSSVLCSLSSSIAGVLAELILSSLFQEMNWEDVSLYHILESLTTLPTFHALSLTKAKSIALASQACWSSQEPLLREASQANLVKILLSQIDKTELTVKHLCCILGSISGDLLFLKDHSLWQCLVESVLQLEGLPALSAFEGGSIARLDALEIVLTLQVAKVKYSTSQEQTMLILKEVTQSFENSMLQSTEMLYEVLLMIDQTSSISEFGEKAHSELIETYSDLFIGKDMEKLLEFIRAHGMENTGVSLSWLGIMQKLLTHVYSRDAGIASSTASKCLSSILSEHDWLNKREQSFFKPAFRSKRDLCILQFISKVVFPYLDECKKVLVLEILDSHLLQQIPDWLEAEDHFLVDESKCNEVKENQGQLINGISKKEWRLHNENFTSSVWNCLATLCEQRSQCTAAASAASLSSCGSRCLQVVLEWLPRVGRTSVASLYALAETLTHVNLKHEEWLSLVSALLSHSKEYGSSTDLLSSALTLLLHQDRVSEQSMPALIQACCELLTKAQTTRGIAPLLARRLALFVTSAQCSVKNYDWSRVYELVLVPLLLFGPIPDKKLKALRGAALDIFHKQQARGTCGDVERGEALYWSPYHEAQETRCHATLVLLSLDGARAEDRASAAHIVGALRKRFNSANDGRGARDFCNSLPHRIKTRALQAMMVMLPLLSTAECGDLLQWVCCSTVSEQQQPSVRYLMEWMMALCVITWPELCSEFLQLCRVGVKQRPGSVASFLAAVSLLACHVQDEAIVELCMTFTVPWCMAQQYNSRLYAQLAVSNIYQHCVKHKFSSTLNKFAALKDCLMMPEAGSSTDDFFFSIFDPVGHYSIQTIYYELPRLSLLSDDEWLSSEELSSTAQSQSISLKTTIPASSPADHLLRVTSVAAWVTKAAKVGSGEALLPEQSGSLALSSGGDSAAAASKGGNMQRKVIPWSSLSKQQQQEALSSAVMRADGSARRFPLTVVASLLTKATNLGGLCRTCEVLGAGRLVVPSMALLQDQSFLGLSLASHKWIPLVEVNAAGVKTFLRDQRRAGYCIVAVEQTAHSVSLSSFQFPARSLLLLGNEREGLPCSLLREVDVCVEIPQFGVTRSLNAHVAGSLCVWQYVNQHSAGAGCS